MLSLLLPICTQPGHESGDILVILRELDHTVFRREGQNLYMKKKITLVEALCGFQFSIDFLDDRTLLMKCKPGEVVRPGVYTHTYVRYTYVPAYLVPAVRTYICASTSVIHTYIYVVHDYMCTYICYKFHILVKITCGVAMHNVRFHVTVKCCNVQ